MSPLGGYPEGRFDGPVDPLGDRATTGMRRSRLYKQFPSLPRGGEGFLTHEAEERIADEMVLQASQRERAESQVRNLQERLDHALRDAASQRDKVASLEGTLGEIERLVERGLQRSLTSVADALATVSVQ